MEQVYSGLLEQVYLAWESGGRVLAVTLTEERARHLAAARVSDGLQWWVERRTVEV